MLCDIIPGVSQETSWTLTNIGYMFGSFLMFHWVRGIPFEFNGGAYDNLNMWEQIDNGDQYTPTKKFLLCVPILLFLVSTHYTHYDLTYFTINFLATLAVVIPKLPFVRVLLHPPLHFSIAGESRGTSANISAVASFANRSLLRFRRRLIVFSFLSLCLLFATLASGHRSSLPVFDTLSPVSSFLKRVSCIALIDGV